MENLNKLINELKLTLKNLKKAPNRKYRRITLTKKLQRSQIVYNEILNQAEHLVDSDLKIILHTARDLLFNIKTFINQTLKYKPLISFSTVVRTIISIHSLFTSVQKPIMAVNESTFKLELAMKAIPIFTGNFKELDSFLKVIEIINNGLNTESKKDLIDFVFFVKLNTQVRTAIGSYNAPNNFEELSKVLKDRYKNPATLSQVLSTLSHFSQKNQSVNSFKDRLTNIIADLNRLQIANLSETATSSEKNVIVKTNDSQALHIFKDGLNENIKQTVISAQPKTFAEAVNIALEVEKSQPHSIMHFRYNNNNNNTQTNRFNTYNNRNNFNNNHRNYNSPNNFNNNNRYIPNNNNRFTRNHDNNRYNTNNNNNWYNQNNSNTRQNSNNNTRYNTNNNNSYRNNSRNSNSARNHRVHVTNYQGNDSGSEQTTPASQN